ncbi:adenylate/guanylate cyclase domain-containing protein [Tardiphaga sp. OK245]|uniref:adenylate/guanylate cyclase domain-containing protein n=1 Tax=Tardiphaga sp. OK245 TaxID=1855306 RepID=UPI0008A7DDC8|nr:adenylate/guanylate cyclase domain-containing protein [Tardiphaga sp. OK245]SEI20806.1 Adenylate cyclase, class 3 [Tardiphaga sp. OK245]
MIVRDRLSGLFRKYFLILFVAVSAPVAISGLVEARFSYWDQRARLDQLLGVQAASAASEIHDFIFGIADQLGWLIQTPWTSQPDEGRKTDALRLFRQAPAVVSLTLLDNNFKERLHVARIGLNRIDSQIDRSDDPLVRTAQSNRIAFSAISLNRGSEPYMTIAVVGNRRAVGGIIAEVNLKLIWNVIAAIKVGNAGHAFVLDRAGWLIAHPDISLVLRGAEEATSRPFRAIRDKISNAGPSLATGVDLRGDAVAAVAAEVAGPDWTVVVQQPLSEAFAPIYRAFWRTISLLVIGTLFAGLLAYALARKMTSPIRILEEGTKRIGSGDFGHRISIRTGDEFQRLANAFNQMSSQLALAQQHQQRIERLKRFFAPQVADLIDKSGDDSVLDGRRTEVVVIFCDLRGFTAFSAEAAPEQVIQVLSDYYEAVGRVITQHEATLINFTGDGLMVLVNAPVAVSEPELKALDISIEMQNTVQLLMNDWRICGFNIGFGVGLASGAATVGRIGYQDRFDYTAIGSVVNLASRLCASAADGEILLNAELAEAIGCRRAISARGNRRLKGFGDAVPVFNVAFPRGKPAMSKAGRRNDECHELCASIAPNGDA